MTNFNQFLKQAQSMQKKMEDMQKELANHEYVGQSGGSLVKATLNGQGDMRKISIDPSLLKAEEKEILEDLIIAAFNDAKSKMAQDSQSSMSNLFGDLKLPPGFKMPF